MSSDLAAERVSIDLRYAALGYVLECVKVAYGDGAIALRNVAALVDAVANDVVNDDRPSALVHGSRLLDEAEIVELWHRLGGTPLPPPHLKRNSAASFGALGRAGFWRSLWR